MVVTGRVGVFLGIINARVSILCHGGIKLRQAPRKYVLKHIFWGVLKVYAFPHKAGMFEVGE